MHDDETKAWLALALCSSGRPGTWRALAKACGGALQALGASDETLLAQGASNEAIALLRRAWEHSSARVIDRCRRLGIRIAAFGAPGFPDSLAEIPEPPLVLFWRGEDPSACANALAVIGARRCTSYGERVASRTAREAAEKGIVVVSGLARGIDAAAHRGALEAGRTVAVLAGGLDRLYPPEHTDLAARIVRSGGCLVTEQPPGFEPRPWLFPYRNRLITGLSLATVVVEAGLRSGSLASARHALDQGREVFAVPGPIDAPSSEGTNGLIAEGATPLCRTSDLAAVESWTELLRPTRRKAPKTKSFIPPDLGPGETAVLVAIRGGSATCDEIAEKTSLDGTRVLTFLTALELDGLVYREAHGRFRASP